MPETCPFAMREPERRCDSRCSVRHNRCAHAKRTSRQLGPELVDVPVTLRLTRLELAVVEARARALRRTLPGYVRGAMRFPLLESDLAEARPELANVVPIHRDQP